MTKPPGRPEPHLAMSRGRFDVTADGIVLDWDAPLEIAVACDGHVIHAWHDAEETGLAYYLHNQETDTPKPRLQAGAQNHGESAQPWQTWLASMDAPSVVALADMLS